MEREKIVGYVPAKLFSDYVTAVNAVLRDIAAHPCPVITDDTKLRLDFQHAELVAYLEGE